MVQSAGLLAVLLAAGAGELRAQSGLPDAPEPQSQKTPRVGACEARDHGAIMAAAGTTRMFAEAGLKPTTAPEEAYAPCPLYVPIVNWYARFVDGPRVKALTPRQKGILAVRNLVDPFNAATILGASAIGVAADPHSAYGPGFPGWARLVGVSYGQDATSEFFGTFLIPSIAHEDPHYHRDPGQSIARRLLHTVVAVGWAQGDDGHGMPNYSGVFGPIADIAISNIYVPGRQTNFGASAARYWTGLALEPTDNMITEFLPDIARRIHFRVVFLQRIVNQVASTNNP